MQRFIDDADRPAALSRGRFAVLGIVTALLVMAAFPGIAPAATQTLTVEKAGSGTGTVTSSPAGIECGGVCSTPFTEGATVVLKAVSGANTAAVQWSGECTVNLEDECKVTMSAARTVTATFNLLERSLVVSKEGTGTGTVTSAPTGIECGVTCSASYVKGTTVTLTAVPNGKTLAPSWSGCDSFDSEGNCVVTMSVKKTVNVRFDLPTHQLTVSKAGEGAGTVTSAPTGIACGATCSAPFAEESTVTLSGVAGAGSTPVQWKGCSSVSAGKCLVTMSAAKEVTANFDLSSRQLTISKVGTGTGMVKSSPGGIECGPSCSTNFAKGQMVTLTGVPGLHTKAVRWTGCIKTTKKNGCEVMMSSAREVTASFNLQPQWTEPRVTVERKGTGQGTVTSVPGGIECGEDCSETYLYGTQLSLTATPAPGSEFKEWSGGGCLGQSDPCTTSVTAMRMVKAIFVAVGNRTLTVAKAGTGAGTVTSKPAAIECGSRCSAEVSASTKVVLRAAAAKGSRFKGWAGEGCAGTKACRVTMNEARNVTATFEKIPVPPAPPSETFVSSAGRVRGGKAVLRISCNGPSPCKGTLKLLLKIRNAQGQTKGLVVGTAPFNLEAGTVRTLEVKLSQRAMRILASTGFLRLRIVGASESHLLKLGHRPR